uniref:Fibronectin type-III domain-containing protein n=1 Tax=Denticeps clupeoides TaxID=299321 RepID=A0AAY3ZU18_9TELE
MREPVERESVTAEEEERAKESADPGVKKTKNDSARGASPAEEGTNEALTWSDLRPAGPVRFSSVRSDSVVLNWEAPAGLTGNQKFMVKWEQKQKLVSGFCAEIQELTPGEEYEFTVEPEYGNQSPYHTTSAIGAKIRLPLVINFKLENTSMCVQCEDSEHLSRHQKFKLSWRKKGELDCVDIPGLNTEFQNLEPGEEHEFTVYMLSDDDKPIMSASRNVLTEIPPPVDVKLCSDDGTVSVSWKKPAGLNAASYLVSLYSNTMLMKSLYTQSLNCSFQVHPDKKHMISIETVLKNGKKSKPVEITPYKGRVPAPENLSVEVKLTSVSVKWSKPAGVDQVSYLLSYRSKREEEQTISTDSLHHSLHDLWFCTEYEIRVCTVLNNLHHSKPVKKNTRTGAPVQEKSTDSDSVNQEDLQRREIIGKKRKKIKCKQLHVTDGTQHHQNQSKLKKSPPMPQNLTVSSVSATSAKLSWSLPVEVGRYLWSYLVKKDPYSFLISYHSEKSGTNQSSTGDKSTEITSLTPYTEYTVSVCTVNRHGVQSSPASSRFHTVLPAPEKVTVVSVSATSAKISWIPPHGMDQIPHSFLISYWSKESKPDKPESISTDSYSTEITELKPDTPYTLTVCTQVKYGGRSQETSTNIHTTPPMPENLTVPSVSATSAKLTWSLPYSWGENNQYSFLISYHSEESGTNQSSTGDKSTEITGLTPYTEYTVSVRTVNRHGVQSSPASSRFHTVLPAPEEVTVVSVSATSAKISWIPPHGMDQIPHSFLISYWSKESKIESISTDSCRTEITDLKPDTPYTLTVCTEVKHGGRSQETSTNIHTTVPAPEMLTVVSVSSTSAKISWIPPHGMDQIPHSFLISYWSKESKIESISTDSSSTEITELKPDTPYTLTVCTEVKHGGRSQETSTNIHTTPTMPENLTVSSVSATSAKLTWSLPSSWGENNQYSFLISYHSEESGTNQSSTGDNSTEITGLTPYTEYTVSVRTVKKHGVQSSPASSRFHTVLPAPEKVTVVSVSATSAKISWILPHGMDQIPHSFLISYWSKESKIESISTDSSRTDITELKPDTPYTLTVCTEVKHGGRSQETSTNIHTTPTMPENLTVSSVSATSAKLTWSLPSSWGENNQYSFLISYHSEESGTNQSSTGDNSTEITGLTPYTEYTVSVRTVKKHGVQSSPASSRFHTVLPAPEKVTVVSVSPTSAKISWIPPHGMDQIPHSFLISYWSKESKIESISTDSCRTDITDLKPDTPYTLTVCTEVKHGGRSQETSTNIHTTVPAPEMLTVVSVSSTSAKISWIPPHGMDQIPHSFLISYWSKESKIESISIDSYWTEITELN